MVNKPKAKGTAAETRVVNFLLTAGYSARRVALKGNCDEGDIHIDSTDGSYGIMLEVKGGKQTQNIGRKQREDWLTETRKEAAASHRDGYLIIAKHGSSVCDYHVWSSDGHLFWYFDQWLEASHIKPAKRED